MLGMRYGEGMLTRSLGRVCAALSVAAIAAALTSCANTVNQLGGGTPAPTTTEQPPSIGTGQVRIGLILPLSAPGNARVAAASLKNAAEMALADFKEPNIQLLVKDDAGTPQGAQLGAQQAIDEGAELIIGPLFAQSVRAVASVARTRNIPVIAFSTDASVAARGVYLLSFLPEADVKRIVEFAASRGERSFAALLPENGYGSVVEAAFQQEVARSGGRIVALQRYSLDPGKMTDPIRRVAQARNQIDTILIPDNEDAPRIAQMLGSEGVDIKRVQILGTGLWGDDSRIFGAADVSGAWYAAPESAGFRNFATRYRARFGQDPVRTAALAYDAVALVAALVKQQPDQHRFSEQTLTAPSGFAGIDGIFRFRSDGTNERGLAVMRVAPSGGQVISPAPRAFNPGA